MAYRTSSALLFNCSNSITPYLWEATVYASADDFGLFQRNYRAWDGSAFAQDDIRVRKSLTLGLGLRYERFGQFGDELGRNSSFDINKVDPDPPPSGSRAGYVVGSNFQAGIPDGVQRASNTAGSRQSRCKFFFLPSE